MGEKELEHSFCGDMHIVRCVLHWRRRDTVELLIFSQVGGCRIEDLRNELIRVCEGRGDATARAHL